MVVVVVTAGKADDKRNIPIVIIVIVRFALHLKVLRGRLFNDDSLRLLAVLRTVLALCPRWSRVRRRWREEGFPSRTNDRLRIIGRKGEALGLRRTAGRSQHVVQHLRRALPINSGSHTRCRASTLRA